MKMINLRTHTGFSFRKCYGKIEDIVASQEIPCITDWNSTFGHVPFYNLCKRVNKKCILGVELNYILDVNEKAQETYSAVLLAKNKNSLKSLYNLVSKATENFYFVPRLDRKDLVSNEDLIIIIFNPNDEELLNKPNVYFGLNPLTPHTPKTKSYKTVATSCNLYDIESHKLQYEVAMNREAESPIYPSWILTEEEWRRYTPCERLHEEAINNTKVIADLIEQITFEKADLPQIGRNLTNECARKIKEKNLEKQNYIERLNYELEIIKNKNFDNYFLFISDLINEMKKKMLVGPGRGSSGGSLVCYLLGITDIDPIKFELPFERFISPSRADLPDIDTDFADTKRHLCLEYLKEKYGDDKVSQLGTVSLYKPDSILVELRKMTPIEGNMFKKFKDSVPSANTGDEYWGRTMELALNLNSEFEEAYPYMREVSKVENHPRHSGKHAAAILVSDKPLSNYASFNKETDCLELDKYDAEQLNLNKFDCLGLRTLSVIEECLNLVGKSRQDLLDLDLNDKKVFDVLNDGKFGGIFQFSGAAIKNLTKKTKLENFKQITHLTSLARPGALCSADTYFANNRIIEGFEDIVKETNGVIIFQEQIMALGYKAGLSEQQVTALRKTVAKSKGAEAMMGFYNEIEKGLLEKGIDKENIKIIWNEVLGAGRYSFNKSHAVAYSMLTYWTMYLKAYHPLEFGLSTLRQAKGDMEVVNILIELMKEGYEIEIFNEQLSDVNWTLRGGKLIGGYTLLKGVGEKKAVEMLKKKTAAHRKLIDNRDIPIEGLIKIKQLKEGLSIDSIEDFEGGLKDAVILAQIADFKNKVSTSGKAVSHIELFDDTGVVICYLCGEWFKKYSTVLEKNKIFRFEGQANDEGVFFVKKVIKI
jgi:DNA polymerase III alpha subunit